MSDILHISHTDIKSDSRILKEIYSLDNYNVFGLGVNRGSNLQKNDNPSAVIQSINLKSRCFFFLPKPLKKFLMLIELFFMFIIKAVRIKPNIIHCHDVFILPVGVLVKMLVGCSLIYDAHELESQTNGLSKYRSKIIFFVERYSWRFIDALITVSPSIDKWYIHNIGEKYSEIIMNSPIIKQVENIDDSLDLRKIFSIPAGNKIFLYVGMLRSGRGIDLITEVFKSKGIKSHVVFLGYGELTDKLKYIAEEYNNIHVHDQVPHDQVVSIAQSADVGLCLIQNISLSDYYCLPNKLFEYCFSEIPVLASKFPDISNVVDNYKLGLCCDLEVIDIKKSVKVYEQDKVTINMDKHNMQELSWQAQDLKLKKLYDYVLNNRKDFDRKDR